MTVAPSEQSMVEQPLVEPLLEHSQASPADGHREFYGTSLEIISECLFLLFCLGISGTERRQGVSAESKICLKQVHNELEEFQNSFKHVKFVFEATTQQQPRMNRMR